MREVQFQRGHAILLSEENFIKSNTHIATMLTASPVHRLETILAKAGITPKWTDSSLNGQIPVRHITSQGKNYINYGDLVFVQGVGDKNMVCFDCDTTIISAKSSAPVHDSPIPGAGYGRVETIEIPYCPQCTPRE